MSLSLKNITTTIFCVFLSVLTLAQNKNEEKYYVNIDRNWLIELPLWVPGFRGQFTFGEVNVSSSGEKSDKERKRLNNSLGLEFYFVGRVSVRHNNIWVNLDAFSGKISSTLTFDQIRNNGQKELLSLSTQLTLSRINVGYAVWKKSNEKDLRLEVIPYLGLRYYNAQLEGLLLDSIYSGSVLKSWTDPALGIYIPIRYKRFLLKLQGEIGIARTSSIWSLEGQVNYRISPLIDVKIGWNHVNFKNKTSWRDINLEINIILTGPSMGIGFRF